MDTNKKIAGSIQANIDDLYKNTYFTNNDNSKYIDSIKRKMDDDLEGLIDKAKAQNGGTNMADLYARTLARNDTDSLNEIRSALEDETVLADIMDIYSQNALVRDLDREIDTVCKYMPKLDEALDIKKDNVLSADHFNDDAVRISIENVAGAGITNDNNNKSEADGSDLELFARKYDLEAFRNELYSKTAKYGEQFVYIVPYKRALEKLIARTDGASLLSEEGILTEESINEGLQSINETLSFRYTDTDESKLKSFGAQELYDLSESTLSDSSLEGLKSNNIEYSGLDIEINKTGVIPGIIAQECNMRRIFSETVSLFGEESLGSARNAYLSNSLYFKNINKKLKKAAQGGTLEGPTSLADDGLKDLDEPTKANDAEQLEIPGAVFEILEHDRVKPIYINNTCLGYYYIEMNDPNGGNAEEQMTFTSTLGGMRPRRTARENEANGGTSTQDNEVLMKIARKIAQRIDKKFINSNQDIAKEIYTVLKYNADNNGKTTKLRISFIPPSDIIHSYFELNKKTHRGVSDIVKSLFPAKLYTCLYISNTIALLTRGYDKRLYHVKQTIDTNITSVLLNVINQIKRSNFNLRQIENMNNIMNVTGRFNDLVIPQNANGESPVSFEIMPGQNVEVKTEFMNMLEEMAVNQTGVSLEMVNSRYQESTATHLTMSNARFLIKVYARQKLYEPILSAIYTKLYQYEYNTNSIVKVELPPPIMLNFTNTSQILSMSQELIQNIVQMKFGTTQNEQEKLAFTSLLMEYYYDSFLPMDKINAMADKAKAKTAANKPVSAGGGMDGGDMGGAQY
nr:MAG TPA: Portal protein [Caudoviricetes sp.]